MDGRGTSMSIQISGENETRLIAKAKEQGLSVEAYLDYLMNEREEFDDIINRANASSVSSVDEMRARIENGYSQSERGEVVDGDEYAHTLLTDLDEMEHKRRSG